MVASRYVPDLASLQAGFPSRRRGATAALLLAFARWVADRPRSSLGLFHLESEPLPAMFAANDDATTALRSALGIFMKIPPATRLALWTDEGRVPAVVSIAPGELREVAPDLASFLHALARGATGIAPLDRSSDDTDESRAALASWLAQHELAAPSGASIEPGSFARWFEATLREAKAGRTPQLTAAGLPRDLFERIDPLIGHLTDAPAVPAFFASIGIDLDSLRDPEQLRFLARPADGVAFSIAWPWELPSEWRDSQYPPEVRRELELRRVRMLWSVEMVVAPQTRGAHSFAAYTGVLPLGIDAHDDVDALESKLGSPILGRYGTRSWDFPKERRTLTAGLNEGAWIRDDLPRGALTSLRWQLRQSL